jgi:DNA-binding Lrp family transcriptional regulator
MALLDKLDYSILFALDLKARLTVEQLAQKLKVGRDRITYRLDRLIDASVINGFHAVVNPYLLGLEVFKFAAKIGTLSGRYDQLLTALRNHNSIYWVAESDGAIDLMFSFVASGVQEIYQIQKQLLTEFSDVILEVKIIPGVEHYIFERNYLVSSKNQPKKRNYFAVKGANPGFSENQKGQVRRPILDEVDKKILATFAPHCRISISDLADKVNMSPAVVRYRIEQLEKSGVIIGYRTALNLDPLDLTLYKATCSVFCTPERKGLFAWCEMCPYVVYYSRQLGLEGVEIEFEVNDYKQYNDLLRLIRNQFQTLVRNVETTLIRREYYRWEVLPKSV